MNILVRFQGLGNFTLPKNVLVLLACNVMKQTLSNPALFVSYISKTKGSVVIILFIFLK